VDLEEEVQTLLQETNKDLLEHPTKVLPVLMVLTQTHTTQVVEVEVLVKHHHKETDLLLDQEVMVYHLQLQDRLRLGPGAVVEEDSLTERHQEDQAVEVLEHQGLLKVDQVVPTLDQVEADLVGLLEEQLMVDLVETEL
jgi:hypothetical protein